MEFSKLSKNSETILNDIVNADNPSDLLCEKLNNASPKENETLQSVIRELCKLGYINVFWADNLPYHVVVNNSAKTYHERIRKYENEKYSKYSARTINNNIIIGNNNNINKSNISSGNNFNINIKENKKGFFEKHPILTNVIMGLITGLVLMFPFWQRIIDWIGGLFKW